MSKPIRTVFSQVTNSVSVEPRFDTDGVPDGLFLYFRSGRLSFRADEADLLIESMSAVMDAQDGPDDEDEELVEE